MNREAKEKLNREYIDAKVNPIFEKLLVDILISKPDDVVIKYFFSFTKIFPSICAKKYISAVSFSVIS